MDTTVRTGLIVGLSAYMIWGFFPIYFKTLQSVPADMLLAHRIFWSVPTAIVLIFAARKWDAVWRVLKDKKMMLTLLASGMVIGLNWLVYIWAVQNERVIEASLGYYMNPLVSFLFAAIFFSERFSKVQMIAMVLAGIGVINQTVVVGVFPWVGLTVCFSFAAYGAIRKTTAIDSRVGFIFEVVLLMPLALAYLVWNWSHGAPALAPTTGLSALLILSGVVTAAPLILFAMATRRVKLSTVAIMQFLTPTLQLCLGLWYGEPFTPAHAVTFGFIWSGVALFVFAGSVAERKRRLSEKKIPAAT